MTAIFNGDPSAQVLFRLTEPARRKVLVLADIQGKLDPAVVAVVPVSPLDILSFTGPADPEIGDNLLTPAFLASLQGPNPTAAVLTDSEGSASKSVLVPDPTSFNSDGTFSKSQPLDQVGFTYTIKDGALAKQKSLNVTFLPRIHVGVSAPLVAGAGDEAFIESLALSQLQKDVEASYSVNIPSGQRGYIAMPDAFVALFQPLFTIGVATPGGVTDISTGILVTPNTPNGVAVPYTIFMTQFGGFDATTLSSTTGVP